MRTSKSNSGFLGGHFCNGESAHRCWVQTLSHFVLDKPFVRDISIHSYSSRSSLYQRLADEKAIALVNSWLEETEPFDKINAQNILISISTGFVSKDDDGINPEIALESGRKLQVQLHGNIPTATLERKLKVKSLLAALRKNIIENPTTPVNALKYFNRLVILVERESSLKIILGQHKMAPIPMSLFSQKDQLIYGGDKASFAQRCLKDNVTLINIQEQMTDTFIFDGGWLLCQTR